MPVLVGFAPTPEGRAAVRRAVIECSLRGTGLVLVTSERVSPERPGILAVDENDCATEIASACADTGVADPGHEIRIIAGSVEPADDVLTVAEESGAELIVIGLRRRSPVGKLILGASAQRILLEATCPVLAVKASGAPGHAVEPAAAELTTMQPAGREPVTVDDGGGPR